MTLQAENIKHIISVYYTILFQQHQYTLNISYCQEMFAKTQDEKYLEKIVKYMKQQQKDNMQIKKEVAILAKK